MKDPWRILLAIVFPPLAVLDKGCGTATLVFALTLFGWFPGVIAALLINASESPLSTNEPRFVEIPRYPDGKTEKRKAAFIRLQDGEVAEVIEDDGIQVEKRKHNLL